jgi:cell division transport system permease protein
MSAMYSLREGLSSFKRAKLSAFAATSAMVVALTLVGVFGLLGYHAEGVSSWLRQQVGEFEVFLSPAGEERADALQSEIHGRPGVSEIRFISSLEADSIFQEEFGEDSDVFLGEHFLPASVRVRVRPDFATVDSISQLVSWIEGREGVDEVIFNQPLLARVQGNVRVATMLALAVGLLVALASLFLVANTIRLSVYARRLLIRTMKLVGATDRFVRRPFLVEGVLQGLLGGMIASAVVWGLHTLLIDYIPLLAGSNWPYGNPTFTFAFLVVLGAVLGWLGARFAAQRFIRNVSLH